MIASHIGLRSHFKSLKKFHDERILSKPEMSFMYSTGITPKPPSITGFLPELTTLHRIWRKTLAPREGDATSCPAYEQNLIKYIKGQEKFNVFDYILMEI
jgi:hypothetical protein